MKGPSLWTYQIRSFSKFVHPSVPERFDNIGTANSKIDDGWVKKYGLWAHFHNLKSKFTVNMWDIFRANYERSWRNWPHVGCLIHITIESNIHMFIKARKAMIPIISCIMLMQMLFKLSKLIDMWLFELPFFSICYIDHIMQ